jgi:hypothetical protein
MRGAFCRLLIVSLLLGGCGVLDRYEARLDAMNRSMDRARNEMLLLNVLRAGQSHPMTFLAITNLSAQQGVDAALAAPTVSLGPTLVLERLIFGGNDVAARAAGSIAAIPLESREFYQGLLQPIPLPAAQFLMRQGYPRQVLFRVLIESIRLRGATREVMLWNDPTDEVYPRFEAYLQAAISAGLSLEVMPEGRVRACFDRGLAPQQRPGLGPVCGAGGADGLRGLPGDETGGGSVEVTLRSTFGVFRYLGRLAEPETGARVRLTAARVGGISLAGDTRLFPILREPPPGGCVAAARFLDETYCIAARGAEQGPLILQLLAQLLALNVSVRDLPAVPTVRLTN